MNQPTTKDRYRFTLADFLFFFLILSSIVGFVALWGHEMDSASHAHRCSDVHPTRTVQVTP